MNTYVHQDKTEGEDHSCTIVEYEDGKIAMLENSWAKGCTFTVFEEVCTTVSRRGCSTSLIVRWGKRPAWKPVKMVAKFSRSCMLLINLLVRAAVSISPTIPQP